MKEREDRESGKTKMWREIKKREKFGDFNWWEKKFFFIFQ